MAELDMARLRELADEFGYWPATTDEADIERHRQHNKNADYWLARGHRFDHLRREHERRRSVRSAAVGWADGGVQVLAHSESQRLLRFWPG
jgi:hypothetical protein